MKVELRDILVHAAIGDQVVAAPLQVKFSDHTRYRREQVNHKRGIVSRQIDHAGARRFGDEQNVQGIGWSGMVKCCLVSALRLFRMLLMRLR